MSWQSTELCGIPSPKTVTWNFGVTYKRVSVNAEFLLVKSVLWENLTEQIKLNFFSVSIPSTVILWTTSLTDIMFSEYNQQDAKFHNLFISVRRSTCFRQFFRPSSGDQNCTYCIRYLSDEYTDAVCAIWAPDGGRKNRLKHVEHPTEINKLWNVASCWLYSVNILKMHRPMKVKLI